MIDWTKPLETVDGLAVKLDPNFDQPDKDGEYTIVRPRAEHARYYRANGVPGHTTGPRLRNVVPSLHDRMVALVGLMAKTGYDTGMVSEARAIHAELNPVDPDLIEARKIAADAQVSGVASLTLSGKLDDQPIVIATLAAIKRARALATPAVPS